MTDPELLTMREAADLLRISDRTLHRLDKSCTGPIKIKLTCRRVGYRRTDLLAWIADRQPCGAPGSCLTKQD